MPSFFPIPYEVEAGKIYYWCSCGKSKQQPLCDQKSCDNQSIPYRAILTETLYFCGCKQTRNPPLCDGSHAKLMLDYIRRTQKNT
nr:CDGSH iron-sulfur domain-containing protein [Legionella jordanis]